MRIAIGAFAHETSTFATVPTTLADFEKVILCEGEEVIRKYGKTATGLGGFVAAGRDFNFEIVPTIAAWAMPAGPVTAEATSVITTRLLKGIRQAMAKGDLDGVLLDLHGAMVSELDDDGESYILRAVREVVGDEIPIIVELDLHGNITQEMVNLASIPVAYDEYPHVDTFERGYEAGRLMTQIVRGGARPTSAIINIPLLASVQRQFTYIEPMLTLKRLAREIEHERGVLNVSYLPGFCYADIEATSFSIIVTTDNNPAQAQEYARQLANYVWDKREQFMSSPTPVYDAVEQAMSSVKAPVVLADLGDNPGGGTPCDGTVLLEALLKLGAKKAALSPICDPEVVALATKAGAGAEITVNLGGKLDSFHGKPLPVTAKVLRLHDGKLVTRGKMMQGLEIELGACVVLEVYGQNGGSVQVVVSTLRYPTNDLELYRAFGIEPTEQQILICKSSVHYRADFTPIAAKIIEVDTPGLTSPHLEVLEYKKLKRPIYPFDKDMVWQA
jgi:microcystin degradation protein MlrC